MERQNEIEWADQPEHEGERSGCSGSCSGRQGDQLHSVLGEPHFPRRQFYRHLDYSLSYYILVPVLKIHVKKEIDNA